MQGLVTVFGGTGFVGRYVVRALAREGWRIRVAARNPNRAPELKVMGDVGQIEFAACDVTNPAAVDRALTGAGAAVNLVGVLAETGRQTFEALQAKAAATIAQAAAVRGIARLVQVSAIGADAGSASAYARTKAKGEAAVRAAVPTATILRPSIVFGPEDDFFNRFAAMAAISPVLPLVGGGRTRFQPVYAGDVGAAVEAALRLPEAQGRTYELGGPNVHSFRELMEIMLHDVQRRRTLLPLPFPAAAALGSVLQLAGAFGLQAPLTRDQVELLKSDNVVAAGAPGLSELGVEPTTLESVLPTYLWRFRDGGQFAQPEGHNVGGPKVGQFDEGRSHGFGQSEQTG